MNNRFSKPTATTKPIGSAGGNSLANKTNSVNASKPAGVSARPVAPAGKTTAPAGRVTAPARPTAVKPVGAPARTLGAKPSVEQKPTSDANKSDFSSLKQSLLSKVDKINSYSSSKLTKNTADVAVKNAADLQDVNNFEDVAVQNQEVQTPFVEQVEAVKVAPTVVEPVVAEAAKEVPVQNNTAEEPKPLRNYENREDANREFSGSGVNNQSVNERFERQGDVQSNSNQKFATQPMQAQENSAQAQNYEKSFAEIRNLKSTISGLQSTLLGGRATEGRSSSNYGSQLNGQMVGYEGAGSQPVAYQTSEHQATGYQTVGYASGGAYESGDSYGVVVSGENRNLNGNLNTYYDNYNNGDIIMHNATDRELEREIYDLKTSLAVLMEKVAAENNRPATVVVDNGARDNLRLIHELRTSIAVLNERISNKNSQQRYIVYR